MNILFLIRFIHSFVVYFISSCFSWTRFSWPFIFPTPHLHFRIYLYFSSARKCRLWRLIIYVNIENLILQSFFLDFNCLPSNLNHEFEHSEGKCTKGCLLMPKIMGNWSETFILSLEPRNCWRLFKKMSQKMIKLYLNQYLIHEVFIRIENLPLTSLKYFEHVLEHHKVSRGKIHRKGNQYTRRSPYIHPVIVDLSLPRHMDLQHPKQNFKGSSNRPTNHYPRLNKILIQFSFLTPIHAST